MSVFAIEKGIDMPNKFHGNLKGSRYPVASMEVGDSFFVPSDDKHSPEFIRGQIIGAYGYIQKRDGKKFATRSVDNGIRCWRVA